MRDKQNYNVKKDLTLCCAEKRFRKKELAYK